MPRSSPPPPPPSSRPPKHEKHRGPKRAKERRDLVLDGGDIDAALTPLVPNARDRAFVLRCILEEGPRHHRVASWALLRLLATVLAEVGGADDEEREQEGLPMRLPPSVASSSEDAVFPIGFPRKMLHEVFDERERPVALECLSDGPPHHALANAAMASLIDAIYERVRKQERKR